MRVRVRDLSAGVHRQSFQEPAGSLDLDEEQYHFTKPISVECTLQKVGEQIVCRARVTTSIELECSRCLEPREEEIGEEMTLLIALSGRPERAGEDPEVKVVLPGAEEVDLSEEIRQTVLLAIPEKPLCQDDCLGLCPQCGTNLNLERCHCQGKVADSRWSGLQKLLSNKPKGEASGRS
jgi:uncharacterized protein